MNAIKNAIYLLTIMILLSFSGWYYASTSDTPLLDEKSLAKTLDLRIAHLLVKKFDANGALIHFLTTPLLTHMHYQDTHHLDTPIMRLSNPGQSNIEIHSKEAIAYQNGETIHFQDHVIVEEKTINDHPKTTLKTDHITLRNNAQFYGTNRHA